MVIEFLSIIVFTFALGLLALGVVTWWMESSRRKTFGIAMMGSGLLIAATYAFLGSRFSLALFGRLIITVDLPRLMITAMIYTTAVLVGLGMAALLFLWISQRFVQPTRLEWQLMTFFMIVLLIALVISYVAVQVSR